MTLLANTVRVPGTSQADQGAKGTDTPMARRVPDLIVTRLEWLPAGGEVRESLRLLDPTPLFMPGGRMRGAPMASDGVVERPGGGVTESVPATFVFTETAPAKGIFRSSLPNSPAGAAERVASSRWFEGMARTDGEATSPGSDHMAGARMDVFQQGAATPLAGIELPAEPVLEAELWQPIELSVLVNAAGAVTSPVVMAGSGVGEIDDRVRVLVKQDLLPRLRLRPGVYRLVVGP